MNLRPMASALVNLGFWLAITVTSAGTPPVPKPELGATENFTASDHSFSVALPKAWTRSEQNHPYGDLTPIFGIRLAGPTEPNGVPITIGVLHYSGEHRFTTPEDFIHDQLHSMVRTDYEREALITRIKVAGRPAKAFQIKTFKLVYLPHPARPPMRDGVVYELSPPYKLVDLLEQHLVVPSGKGYFVLSYCAPQQMAAEHQGTFDQVVASFRPHLP